MIEDEGKPDWAQEGYDPTATENSSRFVTPLYSELQDFLQTIGYNPMRGDDGNPITDMRGEAGIPPSETAVAPEMEPAPPPSETAVSSPLLSSPPPSETAVVSRLTQPFPQPSTTPADKLSPSTTPAAAQRASTTTPRAVAPAAPQGGVLEKIFSGVDFQSNHRPVVENGVINWGNPDNHADFARASKVVTEMLYGGGGQKASAASAPSGSPRSAAVASYGDGSTLPILRAIRTAESSDNPNAKNPRSSAGGLYQFTDGTWGSVLRRMAPDVYANYNDKQLSTLKSHEKLQEMAAKFHLENDILPKLAKHNIPATPGNIYLSWFQGPDGAVRAYNAPDNAYVAQVFPGTVTANAPMRFNGKPYAEWTMRDLRAFTDAAMARRMRAEGGRVELLEDKFPTHYIPHVGRQVMNKGGAPVDDDTVKSAFQLLYELEGREFQPAPAPEQKQPEPAPGLQPLDDMSAQFGQAAEPQPSTMPYPEQMKNVWETVKPTAQGAQDTAALTAAGVFGAPADIAGLAVGARELLKGRVPSMEEMQLPGGSQYLEQRSRETGKLSADPSGASQVGGFLGSVVADPFAAAGKLKFLAAIPMAGKAADAAQAVNLAKRELTPLGLYSHGEEMARALPQEKGTPEQFAGMLVRQGVKPEEMFASGFADEAATAAMRSRIESEFQPKVEAAQKALEGLVPGTPEYKAAERQFKNISSTMRSEIDRALVLSQEMASRPNLTREEAAQYFRQNLPQIEEKVYGSTHNYPYRNADDWQNAIIAAERRRDFDEADRLTLAWEETEGFGAQTKYQSYTLPGGENYREVLLKAPPGAEENPDFRMITWAVPGKQHSAPTAVRHDQIEEMRKQGFEVNDVGPVINKKIQYQSSHWDDPNVIAHIRLADRTVPADPNRIEDIARKLSETTNAPINSWGSGMADAAVARGIITPEEAATYARSRGWTGSNFYNQKGLEQKILHVEELQSDWAQAGRKEGFKHPNEPSGLSADETARYRELSNIPQIRRTPAQQTEFETLNATGERRLKAPPVGPYVTNTQAWTDLALKRVLNEAAKGGYDKIVWTPGVEQVKRYRLSNHVDRLVLHNYSDGMTALTAYRNGEIVTTKTMKNAEKELPDLVGKEVAQKLIEAEPYQPRNSNAQRREISGQDLDIGGSGMKGYYDKIVPTQLQKLVKKLDPDAKFGKERIAVEDRTTTAEEISRELGMSIEDINALPREQKLELINSVRHKIAVPSLEITPKMRENILRGLAAYADGGAVDDNQTVNRALEMTRHFGSHM